MKLLEKFWYGNIEPTKYDTNACKEYMEELILITQKEKASSSIVVTMLKSDYSETVLLSK